MSHRVERVGTQVSTYEKKNCVLQENNSHLLRLRSLTADSEYFTSFTFYDFARRLCCSNMNSYFIASEMLDKRVVVVVVKHMPTVSSSNP